MVTVEDKIRNALNLYNKSLKAVLDARYVRQVDGKDLSTNDFTDELKDKLADISGDINLSVGDEAPSGGIWIDPLK